MQSIKPDFFLSSCLIRKKFEHSDSFFPKQSFSITQPPDRPSPLKTPTTHKSKAKTLSRHPSAITNNSYNYSHSRFANQSIFPLITDNSKEFSPSPSPLTVLSLTQSKLVKICSKNTDPTFFSKKLFNKCMSQAESQLKPLKKCTLEADSEPLNSYIGNLSERDKSVEFCKYLRVLKEKGSDKSLNQRFLNSSIKKTRIFTNAVKNLKIMQLLKGNSKGETFDSLNKLKQNIPLQKKILIKTPEENIEDLIDLLELLKEIYGSWRIALSILKNFSGFRHLEKIFIEPRTKELNLIYTTRKMKEDKGENDKNLLVFIDQLKDFLKKKQMDLAEKRAKDLQGNYKELKRKTFDYLTKLKIKNQKKYTKEKEFLINSIDFIQENQIQNKNKLKSLEELEVSEKIVGKFEKINDISRFIAKSLDLICKKTGF